MIRLSVISGPDAGKTARYSGVRVTMGRGPTNDFALRDGLVSQYHGEVCEVGQKLIYRDLKSRHGTLVRLNSLTVNLHDRSQVQEIDLADTSHVIVGETLVKIEHLAELTEPVTDSVEQTSVHDPDEDSGLEERVVKRTTESLDAVTRRLIQQDPRLVSIFKLSRSLNAVTELDEVLNLIIDMTFDAFPAANFFAVTLSDEATGELKPLLVRERDRDSPAVQGTLLSQSLLEQVLQTQQSVLFVRDESGIQPTESIINARITACLAAPLVGQRRILGVVQADTRGTGGLFGPDDLDLFTVLASYTAFAIERANLTRSIYEQFEGIVRLSVAAIDARDPSTAGHSERVADYTMRLAHLANRTTTGDLSNITFSREEVTELRYAALLHDFGKIGVRESVLMKPTRLSPETLELVYQRIETARQSVVAQAFREAFDKGQAEDLSLREVRELAHRVAADRTSRLDDAERLIAELQPGQPLNEEHRDRVSGLSDLAYIDSNGQTQTLLREAEIENLLIPRGTLNEQEWEDMKSHARKSREFLCQIRWSDDLARIPDIAGMHHEKLDGSGYPDGIVGDEIPVPVRILTIADIFDAMTAADRPYRKAASFDRACDVLQSEADRGLLDDELVGAFVQTIVPAVAEERRRSTPKPQ